MNHAVSSVNGTPVASDDVVRERTAEELVAEGLLSVKGAAAFLGLSQKRVRQLLALGELRFVRIDKRILIPRLVLVQFAAARLSEGGAK